MCAGHSVSKGICGHKDVMQVGDWDAMAERQMVDVRGGIGGYREVCGLM